MPFTDIQICSDALAKLGAIAIDSFTDDTNPHANTCDIMYRIAVESAMSQYPWKFTIKQRALTLSGTAPVARYPYAFDLPPDCLSNGAIAIYRTDNDGETPVTDFVIQGAQILSHESTLYADYQAYTAEAFWPPTFVDFISTALAFELAMSVTKKLNIRQQFEREAYGRFGKGSVGGMFAVARNADARTAPANNRLSNFPLISVRYYNPRG
jgi:hypothetical protein